MYVPRGYTDAWQTGLVPRAREAQPTGSGTHLTNPATYVGRDGGEFWSDHLQMPLDEVRAACRNPGDK